VFGRLCWEFGTAFWLRDPKYFSESRWQFWSFTAKLWPVNPTPSALCDFLSLAPNSFSTPTASSRYCAAVHSHCVLARIRVHTSTRVYMYVLLEHVDLYEGTHTHTHTTCGYDYNVYARSCAATCVHIRIRVRTQCECGIRRVELQTEVDCVVWLSRC